MASKDISVERMGQSDDNRGLRIDTQPHSGETSHMSLSNITANHLVNNAQSVQKDLQEWSEWEKSHYGHLDVQNPTVMVHNHTRKVFDFSNAGPEDFEKIALIGKGDIGRVYLVRYVGDLDDSLDELSSTSDVMEDKNRLFAMKVLSKEEMISRNKIKRVLTEREILATADHPFIVSLYCSFQSEDHLYFIMEYCAGGEFFRLLRRQPQHHLNEDAVRFYAAEVLLALEYLHFMGFIYRDLKPENILVHESGHIRLTDFDLSKQTISTLMPSVTKPLFSSLKKSKVGTRQIQQFNSFVGTEEYIAPEIITGQGHSSSVDWWTFGILIYEMTFGCTPFKGSNQNDTFANILNKKITWSKTHPISKNLKDLLKKLLCTEKKRRLGHKNGAADIKQHPFFKGVKWPLIRTVKPPIIPTVLYPTDLQNFRKYNDIQDLYEQRMMDFDVKSPTNPFKAFEYSSDGTRKNVYGRE